MTGWQPIETAPKDQLMLIYMSGGAITVAVGDFGVLTKEERKTMAKRGVWPDYREFTPTHWMPLPDPPATP